MMEFTTQAEAPGQGHGGTHRSREMRVIAAGRPGLRLRFYPGVRADVKQALKTFAVWLRRRVEFRHPVRVTVVPQAAVMGHEGAPGWAVFVIPGEEYRSGDVVRIYIAGGRAETGPLHPLLHDLAHEIVHYEQWRDGRRVDERNVNRRAASLLSRHITGS